MPCHHIGFNTGNEEYNTASSYNSIELAQPATNAVCMKCTAIIIP